MAKDYYQILGIDRSASAEDIKRAYRRLSKELHPDKHKGDKEAERKFKEVNAAYEALNDPQKKRQYDQFGTTGGPRGGFSGSDFSGFQGGDFGGFSDIFESFFGEGGARHARQRSRGQDLQTEVSVGFMDMVGGVQKGITLRSFVACDRCGGTGADKGADIVGCRECGGTGQVTRSSQSFFGTIEQSFVCPVCRGRGKVPEKACNACGGEGRVAGKRTVTVAVPPGIHDGQTMRLKGQGEAGPHGGEPGDLFVIVRVREDERFRRDGDDVRVTLRIPVLDAILGTQVQVETVHGKVTLNIPEGTQSGQVLRLKGKGLPVLNTSRIGDHFVEVAVEIPKRLSRREREILEEWRRNR